jgi:hypothetical protein
VSTLAIELNDAGITALRDDEPTTGTRHPSPGFAVVDGAAIAIGVEAMEQARLKPRRAHHRFWSELDTRPLGRPFPAGLSAADLAHAHLSKIWSETRAGVHRVVIALPGSHSAPRMGLILGIAQACGIPVEAIVDAAVAAASTLSRSGALLHLDVELNGVVLTEMTSGRELVRSRVQVGDHTGMVRLRDAWARRIARLFVARTRFDPLHVASTEQQLHGRLGELLPRLALETRAVVELESAGRIHAVEVERSDLVDSVAAEYEGIEQLVRQLKRVGEPATILLSDRAVGLPGFAERIANLGDSEIVPLPCGAAARGALRYPETLRSPGEALPFVTRLDRSGSPDAEEEERPRPPRIIAEPRRETQATHILHDSVAHPITDRPFVVGTSLAPDHRGLELDGRSTGVSRVHCTVLRTPEGVTVQDHSTHGSFLNGQRIDGKARAFGGDRLQVGIPGVELRLITVIENDAPPRD